MRRMLVILCCSACAGGLPDTPPAPGARPAAMLAGVHCGRAFLTKPGGAVVDRMVVTSRGEARGEDLVLDQTIEFADGATAERRWQVSPDGSASYRGTLSGDERVAASGPVTATVAGKTLRIRYAVAGVPFGRMEQFLTLRPDGNIDNRGTVRVLGIPVRRLVEKIAPQPGVDTDAVSPCSSVAPPEGAP